MGKEDTLCQVLVQKHSNLTAENLLLSCPCAVVGICGLRKGVLPQHYLPLEKGEGGTSIWSRTRNPSSTTMWIEQFWDTTKSTASQEVFPISFSPNFSKINVAKPNTGVQELHLNTMVVGTREMLIMWREKLLSLTLPPAEVLLVLDSISQRGHHLLLLEREDAQAFHQPCQTIGCTFALSILIRLQQQLHQLLDHSSCILLNCRH